VKCLTHNNKRELEDWGHCLKIQQNVNESTSSTPSILFQQHNYPTFLELSHQGDVQIQLKNKMKNVPYVQGQSWTIVTDVIITNNNNNVNDGNNRSSNPSDFVTSSSFVPSTPSNIITDTSTNVVSVTTPSFVPPEITIPSCAFSPCFQSEELSNTSPHPPSFDDDDDETTAMFDELIRGAQAAGKQGDKLVFVVVYIFF
jgi:malic enzyme